MGERRSRRTAAYAGTGGRGRATRAVADRHSPRASPRDGQGHGARRGTPGGQLEGVVRGEEGKLACYSCSY